MPVIVVRLLVLALLLVACSTTQPQPAESDPLADLDGCVDRRDAAYFEMREQAATAMAQHGLTAAEAIAGLEAFAKIRAGRGVSLSRDDSEFLTRNGFLGVYGGGAFTPARFAALRKCLEDRHGYKIRTIEVRYP